MKNIINLAFVFFIGLSVITAQNKDTKKADKHFDRLEFVDAAKQYEKLIEKGKGNAYVYKKAAEANYNLFNMKEAERFYKLFIRKNEGIEAEDYFRFASALKINGKIDDSDKNMQEFAKLAPQDKRAQFFKNNPNYYQDLTAKEPNFSISDMEVNSGEYSDFGGYEHNDMLYFVSARNKSGKTYGWNDQPVLNVFVAENVAGTWKNEDEIPGDVNSKFNEGTMAISQDGQTIYFTRTNMGDGNKYEADEEGIGRLRLYKATLVNGRWKDVQPLSFTDSEYSYSHPALSPDGKTLYFSSDMPGGFGNSDIYQVSVDAEGNFGEPENLGNQVNTPGRESFPFMDEDNRLFFSSDGHLGLGGLDVFYTTSSKGMFAYPTNIGAPVNTSSDDFAFSYYTGKESGYVSSNREGSSTVDNIYQVDLLQPLDETLLMITAVDEETSKPIENTQVIVYDDDETEVARGTTDEAGQIDILVISNEDYDVQGNKEGYESTSVRITAEGESMPVELRLKVIEPLIIERKIVLDQVFFDFDKSEIIAASALELDRLAETLMKYEDIRLMVTSHTDRRGPAEYNLGLSEKRAKSTVDYLVSKGVDADRLEYEGKGESEPINDCASGCSEEEHRVNRRSEFTIIEEQEGVETKVISPKED